MTKSRRGESFKINLDTLEIMWYPTKGVKEKNLSAEDSMETKARQAYLYDFYGELLNQHQRGIYEDYAFSDLSLGEIAAEEGISRQGVHDLIRRCSKKLEEYEEKLHLVEKFLLIKEKADEIESIAAKKTEPEMKEIAAISREILEEL